MILDQDLMELEPIFSNRNGNFQSAHPSFQEVLTAKQFANEINSGKLSIKDAYEQFWSYEEDTKLWDLQKNREWRALLPTWKNCLKFLGNLLIQEIYNIMVETLSKNYLLLEKSTKFEMIHWSRWYNPFYNDFSYVENLVCSSKYPRNEMQKSIIDMFLYEFCPEAMMQGDTGLTIQFNNLIAEIDKNPYDINIELFENSDCQGLITYLNDQKKPYRHRAAEAIAKKGDKSVLPDLLKIYSTEGLDDLTTISVWKTIFSIHERLKPQGYNPPIKRLAS